MATAARSQQTGSRATLIEGCLLVGIAAMLLRKVWGGQLPLYIHPRYTVLVAVTAIALLVIGEVRLWQTSRATHSARRRLGVYGLLLMPLLLGVLIPAKPAGSALVDPRQLTNFGRGYRSVTIRADSNTAQWTLLDWNFARVTLTPKHAQNKPVDVTGFVYRDGSLLADQFYVVRYTLSCCVADRMAASLLVTWPDAATLQNDTWVRVTGAINAQSGEADSLPIFTVAGAEVEPVEQPKDPYLYQ
jgi:uncharacterized repeat protein (TIGR03943 family)